MSLVLSCTLHGNWLEESPRWASVPRRLGFQAVQLLVHGQEQARMNAKTGPWLQLLRDEELQPVSLWLKPGEEAPTLSQQELVRLLDALEPHQVRWLVLPAGLLPGWDVVEQEATAPVWSEAVQTVLEQLEAVLRNRQVQLLLDVAHPLSENPKAIAAALGRWHHSSVRLWLDLGAQALRFPYSQVEVALQRWFGLLGGVALRDAVPEMPLAWTPSPGQGGEIDFARCWQVLSTGEFQGLASVVQGRRRGRRRELTPQQWEAELREGLEHLHHCGWPVAVLPSGS